MQLIQFGRIQKDKEYLQTLKILQPNNEVRSELIAISFKVGMSKLRMFPPEIF